MLQQEAATYALLVATSPGLPLSADVTDRAARLLGIVYGNQGQLAQRPASLDLYTQLRSAGVEIDPRQIRALSKATDELYGVLRTDAGVAYDSRLIRTLTAADTVDISDRADRTLGDVTPFPGSVWDVSDRAARLLGKVYGDTGLLAQRAATLDAYVQLRNAGVEIDPRSIRALTASDQIDVSDRAARLLGVAYGNVGQLQQRAVSGELLNQLVTAGTQYDARQIRALVNTDVVGVADAAGNRMPSMDAAARAGYMDVTDRWARQVGAVDVARAGGAAMTAANPIVAGVYDAAGNRQPAGDVMDRPVHVMAKPYYVGISEGEIPGHTPFSKFGEYPAVVNAEVDIWPVGGKYVFPTVQQRMEVVSSSVNDTSPAGTGIQKVTVYYLDAAYAQHTETVTLSGTTVVATAAADIFRVNYMRANTVGTGGSAAGDIDIRNLADTPIYGRIPTGYTSMRQAVYTVPAAMTLYISSLNFSSVSTGTHWTKFINRAKYDSFSNTVTPFFLPFHQVGVQNGAFKLDLEEPTKIPATVDLTVSGIADAAAANCQANVSLRGWTEA